MDRSLGYMQYGPFVCIGIVLAVLFVLWLFWGGKNYDFVGLAPLSPETCGSYTGSVYNWGNITPANAEAIEYDPFENDNYIPPDTACMKEEPEPIKHVPPAIVDNTPIIPQEILTNKNEPEALVCHRDPVPIKPRKNSKRFVSRGERLCCQTMERIYGVPFVTVRPSWLRNHTGMPLELDCYNADLQLAVEYNGAQHYVWPNFTNQSYQEFLDQIERDRRKMEICDRNGVYLIVVPYNVPYENIPEYIMSHLPETIRKRLQEEETLSDLSK